MQFIDGGLVYRLPWAMEALRVRAAANGDVVGVFSLALDDHELGLGVPAVETGTMNRSASILIEAGFNSRLAVIKVVEDTAATFRVSGKLAQGLLEIVDTNAGERFRLRVSRHAEGLAASVEIKREGGAREQHALVPVDGNHHVLQSVAAPAEPHEFQAELLLTDNASTERLPFQMLEPEGHHH